MAIKNNFRDLLEEKGKKENRRIPLTEVAKQTDTAWVTVDSWYKDTVTRFDRPILDAFCNYFGVSVGELLEFTPQDNP